MEGEKNLKKEEENQRIYYQNQKRRQPMESLKT